MFRSGAPRLARRSDDCPAAGIGGNASKGDSSYVWSTNLRSPARIRPVCGRRLGRGLSRPRPAARSSGRHQAVSPLDGRLRKGHLPGGRTSGSGGSLDASPITASSSGLGSVEGGSLAGNVSSIVWSSAASRIRRSSSGVWLCSMVHSGCPFRVCKTRDVIRESPAAQRIRLARPSKGPC